MGVIQSLKELYYHLEDKYYELIERISTKVPIYKVTDAIDKVVPSFALLLLVIAVLIGYALISFAPAFLPKAAQINVKVSYRDRYGDIYPLEGARVTIINEERSAIMDTNEDGMLSESYIAKVGDHIALSISMEGFKPNPYTKEFDIRKEFELVEVILEEIIKYKDVSFRLVDEEGNPIANKYVSLSFECGNNAEAPADMETITDYTGLIEVKDVPIECDPLLVSISAPGYEQVIRKQVSDGSAIVLKPKEELTPPEEKGRIIVSVEFNNEPVQETIVVELYKDTGAAPIFVESKLTENGQAVFEVLPGTYKVKTRATERFTSAESGFITVGANEYRTVVLAVEERIIGYIRLRIIDEANKEPIKDTRVTLFKDSVQFAFDETDENGIVQFNLTKDESFDIVIDHPEYCLERLHNVRKSESTIEVKLKKYTGDCGGILIIKVVDDVGMPIPNAKVGIFDENGNALGWKERLTDINGEARFKGLREGKYKFFAYKGYGSGWSDVVEYKVREAIEKRAIIVLHIPKATLEVRVVNYELEPLPFSMITVKNALNNKIIAGPMVIEDLNGRISFKVGAGLPIYLYITHEGYANFTSEVLTLIPNEVRSYTAVLDPKRISGEIKAEFLGLFKNNKIVSIVAAGEEYIAKFKITVPEHANYEKFGLHIRTGKYNIMEKDFIYIKDVYAPGKPNIIRGTSFNPDKGISYDTQFLSADGAKWFNLEWSEHRSGVIYVDAKIKVKETAVEEELPIFWRAWGIREGKILRDPIDYTLGDAPSEQDLYARAYKRTFQVGMETLCTDKWCVSIKILDLESDVAEYVDETYYAKVGKSYKLYFSILNNSPYETDTYTNVQLKILNKEKNIVFSEYSIVSDTISEGVVNASETPYIEIGDLPRNKEVRGEIEFTAKAAAVGSILIRIHDPSRHRHIFEKEILVDIAAAREFLVEFKVNEEFLEEPPLLPSGIENTLIVRVRDKDSGLEVSDALVKIKDKFGSTLISTSTTSRGLAEIVLPALMPGEIVYLAVEKPDYAEFRKEIKTDDRVLKIEPERISLHLNVTTKHLDSATVRLLNETEMELKIESIELRGDFFGLIDEQKVHSWLSSEYFQKSILPKDKLDIALKVQLSDLGKMLNEGKQLGGKLVVVVSALGQSWVAEKDVVISIGLGEEVDDPACLVVSISEWKATTKGNEVRTDFSIVNTCTVDGKPIKLQNLSAKIEWQSNHLGDYYIEIGENSVELRGAYFKRFKGVINEEEEVPAMLAFIPDGGITGRAQATIIISAEHPTAAGKEVLTATIETEIDIISIENCIRYDKDVIRMKPGEDGSFTIETKDCGTNIDFLLDTELALTEKEFTLESSDSKQVTILSGEYIPGQYPIYVKVRSVGESEYSFNKLIRVIIEPEGCLRLSRYEYDIYDDPNDPYDGFDIGLLINECYKKKAKVELHYDERNWLEAMKTGLVWAIVGFIYGGIQSVRHGKDFFGFPLPSTICEEAGYEYCGANMECKGEKIKVVKGVTCCASECIAEEIDHKEKICAKKGAKYCGPDNCPEGKEILVEGLRCCKDKCLTEQTLEKNEAKCRAVDANFDFCCAPPFCDYTEICPAQHGYERVGDIWCCKGPCVKEEVSVLQKVCENPGEGAGPYYYCNPLLGQTCPEDKMVNVSGVVCCSVECVEEKSTKTEETTEGAEAPLSFESALKACQKADPMYTYCDPAQGLKCVKKPEAAELYTPVVEFEDPETGETVSIECCDTRTGVCSGEITEEEYKTETDKCIEAGLGPYCPEKPGVYRQCINYEEDKATGVREVDGTPCCPAGYTCRYLDEQGHTVAAGTTAPEGTTAPTESYTVQIGAPCPDPRYGPQCPPDGICSSTYCGKCIANPRPPVKVDNTYCCPSSSYNKCIPPGSSTQGTTAGSTMQTGAFTGSGYSQEYICKNPGLFDPRYMGQSFDYCQKDQVCEGQAYINIYENGVFSAEPLAKCCATMCIGGSEPEVVPPTAPGASPGTTQGTEKASSAEICASQGLLYCGEGLLCANKPDGKPGTELVVDVVTGNAVVCCSTKCVTPEEMQTQTAPKTPEEKCKAEFGPDYGICPTGYNCVCTDPLGCTIPYQTTQFDGTTITCCHIGDPTVECCKFDEEGRCITPDGRTIEFASGYAKVPTAMLSIEGIVQGAGNLLGSVSDIVGSILNIEDPWTGALIGFVAGTLFKYWEQSKNVGMIEVPVVVDDLVIKSVKILIPKALEETEDTQILAELGKSRVETTQDKPEGIEKIEVIFKNNGITQEEPYKPIYRILKVEGERLDYNTYYEIKSKKQAERLREQMAPDIKSREPFTQKFHLQFNAYKAKPTEIVVRPEASCKIGNLIGMTGPNAVPRVKFRWNWNDIEIDECDEGGKEMYCDATQFSIELLKKIHKIDELLRGLQLNCPSAEGILSEKTQALDELKTDVAVTKIKIEKAGKSAKVIGTIESNNNKEMIVNVTITLRKEESGEEIACPEGEKAIQVISKAEVSCAFNELEDGLYTATIRIYPQLNTCPTECKNENTGNDIIFTKLLVGTPAGVFEKCEPYSTDRLAEFIAANPENANLKKALELVSFNAYLIRDGYTLDFRRDFHEFSEAKDFFNAPAWYKGETGLGKYFVNPELFEFKSSFLRPEHGYLPAGKYHVRISITYNNDCWCLFDDTVPDAKIVVYLERLATPEPDSVFYHLPFDGLIGVDSENGRQGYGINFRQESEQSIFINEDVTHAVRTTTIAGSTPIPGGWLYAKEVQNFKTLNNDMRGVILAIDRGSEETHMVFSPSRATPVILRIAGGERNKAYAFYQVTVDGQPQQASSYLTTWTGIGKGCRDFSDKEVTEAFDSRRDIRGGVGRTKCAGRFDTHQYGLEWCDVKRKGNVFLKTVFFTPIKSTSILEMVEAVDDAVFITPNETGKQVSLSGVTGTEITSVEKVLELVKEGKVCVAGVGNSVKATFFWNPKEIIDSTLANVIESVPAQCIGQAS